MSNVLFALLASEYAFPRLSIDLHPGTLAFVIFCTTLLLGLLAGLVTLGLYSERRKRNAAHHNQWIDDTDASDARSVHPEADGEDVTPFVPDSATPDVSESVHDLFDVSSDNTGSEVETRN